MTRTLGRKNSVQCLLVCSLISLQLISVLAADPKDVPKDTKKEASSGTSAGLRVLLIGLGVAAAVGLSVVLFKLWQKKKREEQHARLLRLFEEDDELELELGLRD
ncbi:hypothetical protein ACHQM5_015658 [Ranunculus cassubicifolius]